MAGTTFLFPVFLASLFLLSVAVPDCSDADTVYYPDSEDCSAFYECVFDTPIRITCPPDTYFNEDKNVCDFSDNVDCGDRPIFSTTTETTEEVRLAK
ncbi:U-scoloptoxin(01)-Tl1a-like [Rhynchophorus ferrugineus]|uniref:U-scoloptoxin(01)-Tl1a-like n=1 Tax=Rhynchophorus ferrugineus TaxID=354439 RepID=UPI003FCCB06D